MKYIKRSIESIIIRYTQLFPVVAVTGPRQTGKSTTLANVFKDYKYVTFDDYRTIDFFANDPEAFMELYNKAINDAPYSFLYLDLQTNPATAYIRFETKIAEGENKLF